MRQFTFICDLSDRQQFSCAHTTCRYCIAPRDIIFELELVESWIGKYSGLTYQRGIKIRKRKALVMKEFKYIQ